jgi:hypothetical protein
MVDYKKIGKRNRINGSNFERLVRKDLENMGLNVSKYQNNIDLENLKVIPAKASRFRLSSTGFPDFIAYRYQVALDLYEIFFIECKINGKLSKEEKEKAKLYLSLGLCSSFYVASKEKIKNKIKINYTLFK